MGFAGRERPGLEDPVWRTPACLRGSAFNPLHCNQSSCNDADFRGAAWDRAACGSGVSGPATPVAEAPCHWPAPQKGRGAVARPRSPAAKTPWKQPAVSSGGPTPHAPPPTGFQGNACHWLRRHQEESRKSASPSTRRHMTPKFLLRAPASLGFTGVSHAATVPGHPPPVCTNPLCSRPVAHCLCAHPARKTGGCSEPTASRHNTGRYL